MEARGCAAIEDAFAATFVRNPYSGDLVRGHRIVLAELGLAAYAGKAPREPGVFAGEWARERRAEHLVARLATADLFLADFQDSEGNPLCLMSEVARPGPGPQIAA